MTNSNKEIPENADVDEDNHDHQIGALRTVIHLTLRTDLRRVIGGCPIEQSGLRENLRTIGAHARRHKLRAEQLLVLIKEVCSTLPEARQLLASPELAGTFDQLITMAVDEFYMPIDENMASDGSMIEHPSEEAAPPL